MIIISLRNFVIGPWCRASSDAAPSVLTTLLVLHPLVSHYQSWRDFLLQLFVFSLAFFLCCRIHFSLFAVVDAVQWVWMALSVAHFWLLISLSIASLIFHEVRFSVNLLFVLCFMIHAFIVFWSSFRTTQWIYQYRIVSHLRANYNKAIIFVCAYVYVCLLVLY